MEETPEQDGIALSPSPGKAKTRRELLELAGDYLKIVRHFYREPVQITPAVWELIKPSVQAKTRYVCIRRVKNGLLLPQGALFYLLLMSQSKRQVVRQYQDGRAWSFRAIIKHPDTPSVSSLQVFHIERRVGDTPKESRVIISLASESAEPQ